MSKVLLNIELICLGLHLKGKLQGLYLPDRK